MAFHPSSPLSIRRSLPNLAGGVSQTLALLAVLYVTLVFLYELPFLSREPHDSQNTPRNIAPNSPKTPRRRSLIVSTLNFSELNNSLLEKVARDSWEVAMKVLDDLELAEGPVSSKESIIEVVNCPNSILLTGKEFDEKRRVMTLPCGLTLGSHITIVGTAGRAREVNGSKIGASGEDGAGLVSQFSVELLGVRSGGEGEDAPRILHFNPRLRGDWSGKQVIEMNTCYRMQWGYAQRCEGWKSRDDEETVDGLLKCEKWIDNDKNSSEKLKMAWWLKQIIGRTKRISVDWPFPFVEDKLFILTISCGLEGYHVNVDGRHVTSFPYRIGFILEEASGIMLNGEVEIQSVLAGSLPTGHPIFASHKHLELSVELQAPQLPDGPVELFVGIISSASNFAERMAIRKSWMSTIRKSSSVVARFFVALNGRNEVNVDLKKEAEFFKDIVIVPFMDSYDLVVLKTIAICEYGVHNVSAKYIMKCDDDTFVRMESVLDEIRKVPSGKSLYAGNINYYHTPLREGKWAVTYEEWSEEYYPPYANGPGYVVSSDIADFIVSDFKKHKLRLFKMEDVSMGMWVEQFNKTRAVEYVHDLNFCQFGCIDDYYTAHYQSPGQMLCMWEKLQGGQAQCCNMM